MRWFWQPKHDMFAHVGEYGINRAALKRALHRKAGGPDNFGMAYDIHETSEMGRETRQRIARDVVKAHLPDIEEAIRIETNESGPYMALVRLLRFAVDEGLI